MEFQFVFTLVFLAMGNYLLSFTGLNYNQVTMYNVLLFGAFFTSLMQVFCVLLLYFDDQAGVMPVSVLYAVANLLLGIWGLYWGGPETYGFTFFLASLFAFVLSIHQLSDFSQHINYFVYGRQPLFYQPPHGPFTNGTAASSRKRPVGVWQRQWPSAVFPCCPLGWRRPDLSIR